MKNYFLITILAGVFSFTPALTAQTKPSGCGCGQAAAPAPSLPQGAIENLLPIGMAVVLGCEPCTAEAVTRALAQGSSPQEVERALHTIAAMQKLDCFNKAFPDAVARMDKPLAAGRRVLQQSLAANNK